MADRPKEDVEKKPDGTDREGAKKQDDSGVHEDMTKRQQQAERPNTADKHLPNVEIEDTKAAEKEKERADMKNQMREKSGREGEEKSRDQNKDHSR